MTDVEEWYNMKLFTSKEFLISGDINCDLYVIRIPSGWLVRGYEDKAKTFIPYDNIDYPHSNN